MKANFDRAVVTGGAGFIGSHLVDALISRGVSTLVIDDFSTGNKQNLSNAISQGGAKLEVFSGSICSEEAAQAVVEFRPEIVFHLAAQINVRKSVMSPDLDAMLNVVGTVKMLDASVACSAKRFIFSSTGGAIYGEQEYFPADENHPICPKCPYGVSKRCAELYLDYYSQHHSLETISLRFANVYGPRQNPKGEAGVVAIFTDRLIGGQKIVVNGDGKQTRDFIYVEDVVRGIVSAASAEGLGKYSAYNLGRGEEISVNQIVEAMQDIWPQATKSDRKLEVEYGPSMPGEQLRSVISPAKACSRFNWQPEVDILTGLSKTVRSFLN